MEGIGGAAWLVLSVRAVREDEVEARLVVEVECNRKLERRLSVFDLSLSVSLVAMEDVETIDRRFARLRSPPPSPLLDSSPLSSSLEEQEEEELGIGGGETTIPTEPLEMRDEGDETVSLSCGVSGVNEILFGRYLGFWLPPSPFSLLTSSEERDGPANGEDRGGLGFRWEYGER
jgi:hypothetical protein